MVYEEVESNEFKFENEGDCIEGVLLDKKSKIGPNEAMLYVLETAKGFENVWGSTILDQRMALFEVGSKIRITYQGKAPATPGKQPANIFKVEVDKEE